MRLIIERPREERHLEFTGTARELLSLCGINPEAVLVVREATLLTREDEIGEADTITLLSVISGG